MAMNNADKIANIEASRRVSPYEYQVDDPMDHWRAEVGRLEFLIDSLRDTRDEMVKYIDEGDPEADWLKTLTARAHHDHGLYYAFRALRHFIHAKECEREAVARQCADFLKDAN